MRHIFQIFVVLVAFASPLAAQESAQMLQARAFYEAEQYQDALALLHPLVLAGDPNAQNMLGYFYDEGLGVAPDPVEALRLYLLADAGGSGQAALNLGIVFRLGSLGQMVDPTRAEAYLRQALARGKVQANIELAMMIGLGENGEPDLNEALRLLEVAIADGTNGNRLEAAYALRWGEYVPQDQARARLLFQDLADQGSAIAMGNLAVMMELGEGGPLDLDKARDTYEAAARAGHVESAFWAAWMYADNPDHFNDPVRGYAYCLSALAQGTPDEVTLWQPDCDRWFGGLSAKDKAAAVTIARQ